MTLFNFSSERSEAMLAAQKDLLETYEQSMRSWLARARSEASLWSELPAKLAGSETVVKAMEAYGDCLSQQMQMSVEDGQRLLTDYREMIRKVAKSFGANWPMAGSA